MPKHLLVNMPNNNIWEMPAYIAKQLYDLIDYIKEKKLDLTKYDYDKEWLHKLPQEDQVQVRKYS
jgi:hypothetical protein